MPTGILFLAEERADLIARTLPEGYRVVGSRKCGHLFTELLIDGPAVPAPGADGELPKLEFQMCREWGPQWRYWGSFTHNPGHTWSIPPDEDDVW